MAIPGTYVIYDPLPDITLEERTEIEPRLRVMASGLRVNMVLRSAFDTAPEHLKCHFYDPMATKISNSELLKLSGKPPKGTSYREWVATIRSRNP